MDGGDIQYGVVSLDAEVGFWSVAYEGLNVGDSRSSKRRVVAVLIAHHAVSPDF